MLPSISRFGHTHITVRIADVGGLESDMDSNVECCAITLDECYKSVHSVE